MNMTYIWLIVVALSLIVEAMTVQMMAVWFAPAGLVSMLLAWAGAPVWSQIIVFIAVAAICVATLYRKLRKNITEKSEKTNIDAIIGATAIVEEDILKFQTGRVKIKGISWLAASDTEIKAGSRVKVLSIDGVTLKCEPVLEKEEAVI